MEDLVLVSDLHLGPGYDGSRGAWHPSEVFFYDEAFAAFVDHLLSRARDERRSWRLVLLGDVFDFRLVGTAPPDRSGLLAASHDSAAGKLDRMATGHPEVFGALRRFVAAGFSIDIVAGNHDVELVRPAVRARLRELVGATSGEGEQGNVSFHPWIYYVPGVLYAEHGHQHNPLQAFATVVARYRLDELDTIDTTLAAFMFERLLALDAATDPCPDHTTPPWRYLRLAAAHDPASLAPILTDLGRFLLDLVRHSAELSRSERRARRAGYCESTLPRYAADVGLPSNVVLALDRLSPASRRPASLRLAEAGARRSARTVGSAAAAVVVASALTSPSRASRIAGAAVGGAALRGSGRERAPRPSYLQRAGASVHRVLRRAGLGVPYYVFGHDHQAQHLPLELGSRAPQYLNTGTWSSLVPSPRPLGTPFRPTFVQVTFDPVTARPIARLLLWDEARGAVEPLRLQA